MATQKETLADLLKWLRTEVHPGAPIQEVFYGDGNDGCETTGSYGSQLEKGKRVPSDKFCKRAAKVMAAHYAKHEKMEKMDEAEAEAALLRRLRIARERMKEPALVSALEHDIMAHHEDKASGIVQSNGEILRPFLRKKIMDDGGQTEAGETNMAAVAGIGIDTLRRILNGELPMTRAGIERLAKANNKSPIEYLVLGGFFPHADPWKFATLLSVCGDMTEEQLDALAGVAAVMLKKKR